MTTKNKESLMGYDPLAWMNENSEHEPTEQSQELPSVDVTDSSDRLNTAAKENESTIAEDTEEPQAKVETITKEEDSFKIILDAVLNIQKVSQLQDQLITAITDNDSLEIDASAVTAIDTASLQLLVILKQKSIKLNREVVFDFPSDRFIEAAELLGIDDILDVNQPAAGFF